MLTILSEGRSYGYAIMQRIHDLSEGDMQLSDGTLYPILHRLETEGLIQSSWVTPESGRKRKYYQLTAAGRESLADERDRWLKMHAMLIKMWGTSPGFALEKL